MAAEKYYDDRSKSYDSAFNCLYFKVYDFITWKYIEPYLPSNPDALILDAAGGTGRWAIRIAEKNRRIILMDMSDGMLRIAAKKAEQSHLQDRITIKKGDITRTEFPNNTFDMILCEHALFLFREPDLVLRELSRILKKNGRLIITATNRYAQALANLSGSPNSDEAQSALEMLSGKKHEYMIEDGSVEVYSWTPNEFQTMLERNGLTVDKIIGKVVTMPLRINRDFYWKKDFSQDLFNKIVEIELAFCERHDALALAGHMQAITRKTD